MIPSGITPALDQTAADIFGKKIGYWQDTKHWTKIRGLKLLNRPGSRRRVYSKEQLLAAHAEEERAKAVNELPKYDLPPVPAGESPDDLLDLEESLQALPEHRRVTPATWKGYRHGTKTRLPEPDFILGGTKVDGKIVGGEDYWRRQTILDWDAHRPGPGNMQGRLTGSKNRTPRRPTPEAEARRARTQELLDENPAGLTYKKLAADLDVHEVHAERLLTAGRREKVGRMLAERPNLTAEQVQEEMGLAVKAHARRLLEKASEAKHQQDRTRLLVDEIPSRLTAELLAEHLSIPQSDAERMLREARVNKTGEMLADRPDLTAEDLMGEFGISDHLYARWILDEARRVTAKQ
ncbi:hypothetical protein ACFQ7N_40350 [Streptomyces niveus]|uniref:hypothetical protein n=1 Tax=Streptomyces niveus TaxID=193462 RepID=UPI0036CC7347